MNYPMSQSVKAFDKRRSNGLHQERNTDIPKHLQMEEKGKMKNDICMKLKKVYTVILKNLLICQFCSYNFLHRIALLCILKASRHSKRSIS